MISPSNTYSGLTRGPASDLESLYPSGERNFVRIAAADHLLAVAEIELAKELGAESVFLLGDFDGMAADAAGGAKPRARRCRRRPTGTSALETLPPCPEDRADATGGSRNLRDLRAQRRRVASRSPRRPRPGRAAHRQRRLHDSRRVGQSRGAGLPRGRTSACTACPTASSRPRGRGPSSSSRPPREEDRLRRSAT
jgi:hypothetical protein